MKVKNEREDHFFLCEWKKDKIFVKICKVKMMILTLRVFCDDPEGIL